MVVDHCKSGDGQPNPRLTFVQACTGVKNNLWMSEDVSYIGSLIRSGDILSPYVWSTRMGFRAHNLLGDEAWQVEDAGKQ